MNQDTHRQVLEDRIRYLWMIRKWYRQNRWAEWSDLRKENQVELRALVAIGRRARKLAAAAPDPLDAYKSLRDFTESEMRLAAGDR